MLDNEIAKKAVRLFLERWRKDTKKSVKHWLVTELGHNGTENIHLHGILWTDKDAKYIEEKWSYGFVWNSTEKNGYVNEKTVNYITKYCTKLDLAHLNYVPIVLSSPGMGKSYFDRSDFKNNKFNGKDTKSVYVNSKGYKIALPIYYRNKIYSEAQREKLWRYMLDDNCRFVDGVKIDMNQDGSEEEYWRRVYSAREKNNRLGFGDDEKDWNKINYENNKRNLLHKMRGIN